MLKVDFIYEPSCPNVACTRALLQQAFAEAELPARWEEHEIGPDAPATIRGFGSPTILVNGKDIAGQSPGAEACCRLYGQGGVPPLALILLAFKECSSPDQEEVEGMLPGGEKGRDC